MAASSINRRTWNITVGLIALTAIAIVIVLAVMATPDKLPVYSVLDKDNVFADYQFTNHLGERVTIKNYEGKVMVVDFIFTHCPTICPDMTKNMEIVQERHQAKEDFQILSFSVDPTRDSVERMQFFASKFDVNDDKWHFLTGKKKELYDIARHGFTVTALEGDGGPDDFIHSPVFVLLDKKQRLRGFYDGTDTTAVYQLAEDIDRLY
jgi:protein SCO1/2